MASDAYECRTDLSDIGRYRTSREPMQVISGPVGSPKIHFEAPPAGKVPAEMDRFIEWFNSTAPGAVEPLAALAGQGPGICTLNASIRSKTAMAASAARWPKNHSPKP